MHVLSLKLVALTTLLANSRAHLVPTRGVRSGFESIPENADNNGNQSSQEERMGRKPTAIGGGLRGRDYIPPNRVHHPALSEQLEQAMINFIREHLGDERARQFVNNQITQPVMIEELHNEGLRPGDLATYLMYKEFKPTLPAGYKVTEFMEDWMDRERQGRARV